MPKNNKILIMKRNVIKKIFLDKNLSKVCSSFHDNKVIMAEKRKSKKKTQVICLILSFSWHKTVPILLSYYKTSLSCCRLNIKDVS